MKVLDELFPFLERESFFTLTNLEKIASELDFDQTPRMSRDGKVEIEIHNRKMPDEFLKYLIFDLSSQVLKGTNMPKKLQNRVLAAAATVHFYDCGYKQVAGISNLEKVWRERLNQCHINGSNTRPLQTRYMGRTKYTDKIESDYPGYIREMYRYAEKTIGNQSSFTALAKTMNSKSATIKDKPTLQMNKMKLFRWFKQQGGKEKSPLPKPYLTEDQKKERVTWCKEVKDIIKKEGKNFYAVFLDEKWFYPTSRRRKLKILPKTEGEDHEDYQPTERRRSNNIKVSKPAPLDCWFVFLIHLR